MKLSHGLCCFFVVGCLSVLGCAGSSSAIKTDKVEGTVFLGDVPLAGASVTFYPNSSGALPSYAMTEANGRYQLQTQTGAPGAGTVPGDYLVTISKMEAVPTGKKEYSDSDQKMIDVMAAKEMLPLEYTDKAKTSLKATVVAGQKNTFDFRIAK